MAPPNHIFKMFGRSPIRPLQEHVNEVYQCAHRLLDFFAAVYQQDWQQASKHHQAIIDLEHKADNLKRDIRVHLPKSLFLPVPRSDLLEILTIQDRIANKARDIAGMIIGRKMVIPRQIEMPYLTLLKRCVDATFHAQKAINELDELLETSFRGSEANIVETMIEELVQIEHETDELQIKVRNELFAIEKTLEPLDTMFLYQVIDWTGDLADRAEQVGNRLQLLLAR
jgi:uncharacterized protein